MKSTRNVVSLLVLLCLTRGDSTVAAPVSQTPDSPPAEVEKRLLRHLDAPLLFVKRHSYTGIHIYDTFYKWPPGGGGLYVLENPAAPRAKWKIRPVIDPTTPGTLGVGVYTHPELSWDATKLLFCFKGEPDGSTSIYEIRIDGKGLRRLSDPTPSCNCYKGSHGGQHDIAPAYLPDGRIVFLSTRPSGLVPCANEGVSILHVMNADGSDVHSISVNNVNEFDPSILPDGRILFGRWEYVDKNALTIQSLWTVNPDGTQETALYANNMVFPEAILDARPVTGTHLILATLAKHNSTPRGSIGLIDPRKGKNDPAALVNLEHPDDPTYDRGDSCEPWPVTTDVFLFSGRPAGQKRNRIEMLDRAGHRITVLAEEEICLHSPILIRPRPVPPALADTTDRAARTGRFFLQDVYSGLPGVERGEVKWLRVIEETSRVSATPGGKQPYNQTFLVSAALAFSVKNYLGIVPVKEDGSAYFEVPSGRAVYFQALDREGRLVRSMRTFVQAAPGTTRSCIGCHENKYSATAIAGKSPAPLGAPSRLEPESWGSGYVDYPTMIQPVLDKHCVRCHGGQQGFAGGMDLSGGWTEHFSISYENLVNRCQTQLVAHWIAGIDCMNGTAYYSAPLFPPRSHGSGAAPLAEVLLSGHQGQIPDLTRRERDLLMAWMDSNGLYHGTWDYTKHGCAINDWPTIQKDLGAQMEAARCTTCHRAIESDWINLKDPLMSRVLRAPLATGSEGFGAALCRNRKLDPANRRVRLLWNGYAHAVQPLDKFARQPIKPHDSAGEPVVSFTSTEDPHYQALLAVIQKGRELALAAPRVDMPGAEIQPGACRQLIPPPLPPVAPPLAATLGEDSVVHLTWERSARTIGLEAELHRGDRENFTIRDGTLVVRTSLFAHLDTTVTPGRHCYVLVLVSGDDRSRPSYVTLNVPPPSPPPAPTALQALPGSYSIRLQWQGPDRSSLGYHVYRSGPETQELRKLTPEPVHQTSYVDCVKPQLSCTYTVRTVSRRGIESRPAAAVTSAATIVREPVFVAPLDRDLQSMLNGKQPLLGKLSGPARVTSGSLDVRRGGHLTFLHQPQFDLGQPISIECWVRLVQGGKMPVVLGCGLWRNSGWFLQIIGGRWRWHVGGIDCDGGKPELGRWMHVAAVFDGHTARLFQDGQQVAERSGTAVTRIWPGDLFVGQYGGLSSPDFQLFGQIAGVKLYQRPLIAAEVATSAQTPPQ